MRGIYHENHTIFRLCHGWLRMADGQRKDAIGRYIQDVVASLPILSYDASVARIHAELRSRQKKMGLPLPFLDGQIAAIAMTHGLTLVTRNTKDYSNIAGLRLDNWFTL